MYICICVCIYLYIYIYIYIYIRPFRREPRLVRNTNARFDKIGCMYRYESASHVDANIDFGSPTLCQHECCLAQGSLQSRLAQLQRYRR